MKQKNEVASKAGTLKTENSIKLLRNVISKSASMLLIAMAGFGTMSFTQDDTAVNSVDTNLSVKKENADAVISADNAMPGDETRNAFISLPDRGTIAKADAENIATFIAVAEMKRLWSMDIVAAKAKADDEIKFSFELRNVYPLAKAAHQADANMIEIFTDDIVLKNVNFSAAGITASDIEVADNFVTAQLSMKSMFSSVALIAKADAELKGAFNSANLAVISLPSKMAADNADTDMMQQYLSQIKLTETVATK
ncbi:MAG: hypothetical protein J0H29_04815 [Sphingobacteriales bacterium]|nr:hypothetical protein [Sphingobacteriales bacterium]